MVLLNGLLNNRSGDRWRFPVQLESRHGRARSSGAWDDRRWQRDESSTMLTLNS